jgi:hypothetical protein
MRKLLIFLILLPLLVTGIEYLTKPGTQYVKTSAGGLIDSTGVGDSIVCDYFLTYPIDTKSDLQGKFYMEIIAWGHADSVHLLFYKEYSDLMRNGSWTWGPPVLVNQIDTAGIYTFYEPIEGHLAVRLKVLQNTDSTYADSVWVTWMITTK